MRVVLQRVEWAHARLGDETVAEIGTGLVLFTGFGRNDGQDDVDRMARKVAHLRVFEQGQSKVGRSLLDVEGGALLISQFTVYGDTTRGRRPGFSRGAPADLARELYGRFAERLSAEGVVDVQSGPFRSRLTVDVRNWGPFTLQLES